MTSSMPLPRVRTQVRLRVPPRRGGVTRRSRLSTDRLFYLGGNGRRHGRSALLGAIQGAASSFVQLLATIAATGPPVALRGALGRFDIAIPPHATHSIGLALPSKSYHGQKRRTRELPPGVSADGTPDLRRPAWPYRLSVSWQALPPPFLLETGPRLRECGQSPGGWW
jgi:hypothetical protein